MPHTLEHKNKSPYLLKITTNKTREIRTIIKLFKANKIRKVKFLDIFLFSFKNILVELPSFGIIAEGL